MSTEYDGPKRLKDPEAFKLEIMRFNRDVAIEAARAGFAMFPANPKTKRPVVAAWDRLDTDIPPEEREVIIAEFRKKNGFDPIHVGCTRDTSVIHRLFRSKLDALPAVACGLSGIHVLDNDIRERNGVMKNGVELFNAFCEPHGGLPKGAFVIETQGKGRHLYFKADEIDPLKCSAGILKTQCETDSKGDGGYVIMAGAYRAHDGRRYGARAEFEALIKAHKGGKLVPVPDFLKAAIGTKPATRNVSEKETQELMQRLREAELPDAATLLDPALDGYDMLALAEGDSNIETLPYNPSGNFSDDRFDFAKGMREAHPDTFTPEAYLALLLHYETAGTFVGDEDQGQGEFNYRNVARDYLRAEPDSIASKGEEFSAVEIEDDEDDLDDKTLREREIAKRQREEWAKSERKERQRERARRELSAEIEAYGEADETPEGDQPESKTSEDDQSDDAKPDDAKPESAKPKKDKKKGPEIFRSVALHDSYAPADDLIEGLLPSVGVAVLVANSNVGKTFLGIEMLDCVMRGNKFLGLNVDQGEGLLVAGEGREGVKKRMAALHKERPYVGEGIAISYDLPAFDAAPEAAALKLKRQIEASKSQDGKPIKLVVLDNMLGMLGSNDLHKAEGVKPMLQTLDALANELKLCIVIIHHENRQGTSAGSFAIRAAVDVMITVVEEKGGVRRIGMDKARDGSKALKLAFRLRYVPLGVNKWGNDVGSCVVEQCNRPDAPVANAMGAVTDDDEAPTVVSLDRREDRVQDVLDVFEQQARHDKERDGTVAAALKNVALPSRIIIERVNARRKAEGMTELGPSTVQALIKSIVDEGGLEVSGTTRLPLYAVT